MIQLKYFVVKWRVLMMIIQIPNSIFLYDLYYYILYKLVGIVYVISINIGQIEETLFAFTFSINIRLFYII